MMERFLKNETYPLLIAKIAIAVQLFFTASIIYALVSLMDKKPTILLINLLLLDILFISIHASYRISYRGPKAFLSAAYKRMLLGHILASLAALGISLYIAFSALVGFYVAIAAIALWSASLSLGALFFFGKYRKIEE